MSIDPEILLGLNNSTQNSNSLKLQREILAMQKLQVLNQVRLSQGLAPLAQPPKEPEEPNYYGITVLVFIFIFVVGGIVTFVFSKIQDNQAREYEREYNNRQLERQEREQKQKDPPLVPFGGGNK